MERKSMTPAVIVERGIAAAEEVVDLGGVIAGSVNGRRDEREVIVYFARGLAIYDVMCGHRVYETAKAAGTGDALTLWQTPFWA